MTPNIPMELLNDGITKELINTIFQRSMIITNGFCKQLISLNYCMLFSN